MKGFLFFLVIVLAGLVVFLLKQVPFSDRMRIPAVTELEDELAMAEEEIESLKGELEELREELARQGGGGGGVAVPAQGGKGDAASARLDSIYRENRVKLDGRREDLARRLAEAEAKRRNLTDNPPVFSEQTAITDEEGLVTGNRGVRTSQADRERAMAAHQREIDELGKAIASLKDSVAAVDAEIATLESQYRAAVAKAKGEVTPP